MKWGDFSILFFLFFGLKITLISGQTANSYETVWYGVGHNAACTFNNKDYLIFHGYDAHDEGRSKLIIKEIDWDENGWPLVSNF